MNTSSVQINCHSQFQSVARSSNPPQLCYFKIIPFPPALAHVALSSARLSSCLLQCKYSGWTRTTKLLLKYTVKHSKINYLWKFCNILIVYIFIDIIVNWLDSNKLRFQQTADPWSCLFNLYKIITPCLCDQDETTGTD